MVHYTRMFSNWWIIVLIIVILLSFKIMVIMIFTVFIQSQSNA